jgi:large subunit ribosomal protein L4
MSLSVTVQNPADSSTSSATGAAKLELPAEVFDAKTNISLIHQVVVAQLAAARQGTHKTKTRGEVRGGGAKPYRQKGTGRARQGSTRAPQFEGGGVVHGPVPRDYSQRTPKKMKAAALRGALSDRARNDRVHVVSSFVSGDAPSTKTAAEALAKVSTAKNVLVVAEATDEVTWLSLRNLPHVHLLVPGQLNTYDVLVSDDIVFTQGALETFVGGPLKGKSAKGAASSDEVDEPVAEAEPVSTEKPAAKKAPAKKAPAKKAAAETAETDDASAPVSTEKAEKPAAKKAPAKKAPAKKATAETAEPDNAEPGAAADEQNDEEENA